ncbi:MAG TPA: hemolysin family protein [Isosphaeraceae bacterium]|nr:hemolysin family protein [Isosphaeraceae bacterium]
MDSLNVGLGLGLGLPLLALHIISVALAKALRTYSRSRLEEICQRRGRPERAAAIALKDEYTERSAEALAVLTGLGLAALLGMVAGKVAPRLAVESVVGIALLLGALGHVAAGVIGRVHAEALLETLWPLASILRTLLTPLTTASRMVEAAAYHLARRSLSAPRPASVEVEIHSVPGEDPVRAQEAEIPDSTRSVLERVIELTRRDVAEMMTPWASVLALPASASLQVAAEAFRESGHSRIPLYGEHRDDIVGFLHVKDLFKTLVDPVQPIADIRQLARPVDFVPETKHAHELLEEFRIRRTHIAIVLDEYGAVSGMVTLEDLLEQIVGPIHDEHDLPPPSDPIVSLGNGLFEVDAAVPPEQLNERLGLHLPTDGDFQTVGGFAFNALGHLPEPGASFRHDGVDFTVMEVSENSIRRLMLNLQPEEAVAKQ